MLKYMIVAVLIAVAVLVVVSIFFLLRMAKGYDADIGIIEETEEVIKKTNKNDFGGKN